MPVILMPVFILIYRKIEYMWDLNHNSGDENHQSCRK